MAKLRTAPHGCAAKPVDPLLLLPQVTARKSPIRTEKSLWNWSTRPRSGASWKNGISALYGKIDFLFAQCQRFLGEREGKLLERLRLGHLSISVDRQKYLTNWTRRENKRNVPLQSVISAENRSGYVFGAHLNFDPAFNPEEIETDVRLDKMDSTGHCNSSDNVSAGVLIAVVDGMYEHIF